ncbi:copper-binding protein [Sphingopyxis lindanitolerans]|uniref:Copper-binding protein n=1 Tax=Sphingopyxis lindanitolerans TaxID=2054227 RepID=A0A2S8B6H3_9SPHN|nr:cupredoxin domain-containing protein [Sphingopyxis lindanitolerans]PQM27933.1 copper-binding protein [Sphingopyxis lindanitolerans]
MRVIPLALAALALSVPVTAAEAPARVTVTLANFSFTPADLHLHAGQPVTIHFVNDGSGGHDFTAAEFFAAATMDAANRARVDGAKGRVSLGKGESRDVTLTPRAGTYKVHCSHFMHSTMGMTGKLVVD